MSAPLESVDVGGMPIHRIDADGVVERVFAALDRGEGGWLVTANVDFIQRARRSPEIAQLYRKADLRVADGAPVCWAARLAGAPVPERVAGADLVWRLAEVAASRGRSIFLLGGAGDAAQRAEERLRASYPGLRIAGVDTPMISLPPTPDELARIDEKVVATRPDLVYVAFGSPKQEFVIDALRPRLPAAWMLGCGVSLSFIAGDVARAPRWMQRAGLEWVHRMTQEPRRLIPRYLGNNLPFTFGLLAGALRSRAAGPRSG